MLSSKKGTSFIWRIPYPRTTKFSSLKLSSSVDSFQQNFLSFLYCARIAKIYSPTICNILIWGPICRVNQFVTKSWWYLDDKIILPLHIFYCSAPRSESFTCRVLFKFLKYQFFQKLIIFLPFLSQSCWYEFDCSKQINFFWLLSRILRWQFYWD